MLVLETYARYSAIASFHTKSLVDADVVRHRSTGESSRASSRAARCARRRADVARSSLRMMFAGCSKPSHADNALTNRSSLPWAWPEQFGEPLKLAEAHLSAYSRLPAGDLVPPTTSTPAGDVYRLLTHFGSRAMPDRIGPAPGDACDIRISWSSRRAWLSDESAIGALGLRDVSAARREQDGSGSQTRRVAPATPAPGDAQTRRGEITLREKPASSPQMAFSGRLQE